MHDIIIYPCTLTSTIQKLFYMHIAIYPKMEIFVTNNIRDLRELTSLANFLLRIFLHTFQSIGIDNVW